MEKGNRTFFVEELLLNEYGSCHGSEFHLIYGGEGIMDSRVIGAVRAIAEKAVEYYGEFRCYGRKKSHISASDLSSMSSKELVELGVICEGNPTLYSDFGRGDIYSQERVGVETYVCLR